MLKIQWQNTVTKYSDRCFTERGFTWKRKPLHYKPFEWKNCLLEEKKHFSYKTAKYLCADIEIII
jgi:hypothetical protein